MSDGSLSIDASGAAVPLAVDPGSPALDAGTADVVTAVAPAAAESAVPIDPAQASKLDALVADYVAGVTSLDIHDAAFASRVRDIETLGSADIKAAADVSNRLLRKPLAASGRGGTAEASDISHSLLKLRRTVEDLDPSSQGNLLGPKRLFGILPFGNRLRDYFARYRSSQSLLNSIIEALFRGQRELEQDNADIQQEKANLWTVMGRLRQYVYLAEHLDAALTSRIAEMERADPDRARALQQDILFPARQKVQDLLTQLAVSVQGYLALDLVRRNNLELIKGVDRATTTTVSALRTAVIVAQALADQRLVLDQITALNATTGHLIESTAEMLRQQSAAINEQAASATIDLATLQAAFDKINATIDDVDAFKVKALDGMSKTIEALTAEIAKSNAALDRARARDGSEAGAGS